jgi:hypothetical protein
LPYLHISRFIGRSTLTFTKLIDKSLDIPIIQTYNFGLFSLTMNLGKIVKDQLGDTSKHVIELKRLPHSGNQHDTL